MPHLHVIHTFDSASTTRNVADLDPCSLSLSAQPVEDVWVARGLRHDWRVVSEFRTFGEWDELCDAHAFLELVVAGNPNLRRLD
jgi:hypothetical protein